MRMLSTTLQTAGPLSARLCITYMQTGRHGCTGASSGWHAPSVATDARCQAEATIPTPPPPCTLRSAEAASTSPPGGCCWPAADAGRAPQPTGKSHSGFNMQRQQAATLPQILVVLGKGCALCKGTKHKLESTCLLVVDLLHDFRLPRSYVSNVVHLRSQ